MPKIKPDNYAKGYGFVTDYLAEIFTRLRRKNYQIIVDAHISFGKLTGRNQDAIKKTTAGLLKLIFQHRTPETIELDELKLCLNLAIECRQMIIDQLAIIAAGEFKGLHLDNLISIFWSLVFTFCKRTLTLLQLVGLDIVWGVSLPALRIYKAASYCNGLCIKLD